MTKQEKKGLKINLIIDKSSFYPLHTRMHFHYNLSMDIDANKKREVKTFFDLFISLYLGKYFSEHSYKPFKFNEYSNDSFRYVPDTISLIFRDKINLNNKQRGIAFNRLHGMVKQAEAYFKYLNHHGLNFNQKGAEYYLKLRSFGKYINKDTLFKRSIITLDVNYLKNYHNFFNRNKEKEDVKYQNKKLSKFQGTMNEIYLDAVAYLKCTKEQTMNNETILKDNEVKVKETLKDNKLSNNAKLPVVINDEKYSDPKELGTINIKLKLHDENFNPYFIDFNDILFPLKHFDFSNNLPDDIFKVYVNRCIYAGLRYSLSHKFEDSNIFFDTVYEMTDNVFGIIISSTSRIEELNHEDRDEIFKVFKRSVELYIKYYKDYKEPVAEGISEGLNER